MTHLLDMHEPHERARARTRGESPIKRQGRKRGKTRDGEMLCGAVRAAEQSVKSACVTFRAVVWFFKASFDCLVLFGRCLLK